MKTSVELLSQIFQVLSSIDSRLSSTGASMGAPAGAGAGAAKGAKTVLGGFNIKDFAQDKKTNASIRDTADAMKILSTSLIPLSKGLMAFSVVPSSVKRSIKDFMKDMLDIGKPESVVSARLAAESMGIIGDSLPKLAKGVMIFGSVPKALITATATGITTILGVVAAAGAAAPALAAGAAVIASIGLALTGIAKVLGGMAKLILAFAGSIVIITGAIWAATELFDNVKPLEAIGIIASSMVILSGSLALIGAMGPMIAMGGIALGLAGKGMLWFVGGLLSVVGSFALINLMTKSTETTKEIISIAATAIGLFGLAFAGIGLLSPLIILGGIAIQHMGKGLLFVAGGMLALGGSFKLLQMMNVDVEVMFKQVAKGLGYISLALAGIGLISPLILMGVAPMMALSVAIGIFGLIALEIGTIINKLGGEDGVKSMSTNVELLVGGIVGGVISGMSSSLVKGAPKGANFFQNAWQAFKNIHILTASILMLTGVSTALITFATMLKAFQKPGVMKDDKGKDVNIVATSKNIADSIGMFFTTLVETLKNPKIIPSAAKMALLSQLLMGIKGPKLLGIRLYSAEVPGIMDALSKFAEVLSVFSRVKQMPVYEVDDKGKVKVKEYIGPDKIAGNVVSSLKAFFEAFKNNESSLKDISYKTTSSIAQILLGRQAFKIYGFKFGRDQVGILEPILKFTEVIKEYAQFGADNKFPLEFNEDGTVKTSKPVEEIARNMVSGISLFLTSFNSAFDSNKVGDVKKQSRSLESALSNFSSVISKFDDLSKSLTGIDKLAASIGTLASSLGLLVENMSALNTEKMDKLVTSAAKYSSKTSGYVPTPSMIPAAVSSAPPAQQVDWDAIAEKIGQKISEKLVGLNSGGEFQFRFMDPESLKGTLSIVNR